MQEYWLCMGKWKAKTTNVEHVLGSEYNFEGVQLSVCTKTPTDNRNNPEPIDSKPVSIRAATNEQGVPIWRDGGLGVA